MEGGREIKTVAEILGTRLLKDLGSESCSLEDFLKDLRIQQPIQSSRTGLSDLDELWKRHGGKLSVCGRGLPLLYQLLYHQIHTLSGTVVLVDVAGTFSPSHLLRNLERSELRHIHVFRPNQTNLQATMDSIESYMVWGEHGSKSREWLGTIVNGGIGGDFNFGWRGWLRIETDERFCFGNLGVGVSVEEAIAERTRRNNDGRDQAKGWSGVSEFGEICWR